jgi:hypothetical protein
MLRTLPLFLVGLLAVSAASQDDPMGEDMADDGPAMAAAMPDLPMRANDEVRASPNALVGQTVGTTDVYVQYGRPSARGRAVYGGLVPYGEVWRTGANEATTFTATADVMVEGQRLPAGTYALFTVPGENAWDVVFNETAEQWGSFGYDESADALRVTVQPVEIPMQEQFLIAFSDVSGDAAVMHLHWDTVGVPVRIEAAE